MNKLYCSLLLCLTCFTVGAQDIKTTEDLLRANLAATGGIDNWRKISSIEIKEVVTGSPGGFRQTFHRIKKFPGYTYSKSIADNPNMYTEMLVTGTPEKLVQAISRNGKTEYKDMARFESYLSASPELSMLEDKLYKLGELQTEKLEDGTECWAFDVTYGTSGLVRRYYDKKTMLLAALTALSSSNNPNVPIKTIIKTVKEHRNENGLLFPSRIAFKSGSDQSFTAFVQVTESITLNPEVEDKIFNTEYVAN